MNIIESGNSYKLSEMIPPNADVIMVSNQDVTLCTHDFHKGQEERMSEVMARAVYDTDKYKNLVNKGLVIEKIAVFVNNPETGEFEKKYFKETRADKMADKLAEMEEKLAKLTDAKEIKSEQVKSTGDEPEDKSVPEKPILRSSKSRNKDE